MKVERSWEKLLSEINSLNLYRINLSDHGGSRMSPDKGTLPQPQDMILPLGFTPVFYFPVTFFLDIFALVISVVGI